jgi:uncharacterized protein (DUF433 family)
MEPTQLTEPLAQVDEAVVPVIREHIVSTSDTCGGKPRIAGSRITVKHIVIMHVRQRLSPEQIVSEYPHLTLADIHAALAYYHDHREAINAEIQADKEWYEQMKTTAPSSLREKLEARSANAQNNPISP